MSSDDEEDPFVSVGAVKKKARLMMDEVSSDDDHGTHALLKSGREKKKALQERAAAAAAARRANPRSQADGSAAAAPQRTAAQLAMLQSETGQMLLTAGLPEEEILQSLGGEAGGEADGEAGARVGLTAALVGAQRVQHRVGQHHHEEGPGGKGKAGQPSAAAAGKAPAEQPARRSPAACTAAPDAASTAAAVSTAASAAASTAASTAAASTAASTAAAPKHAARQLYLARLWTAGGDQATSLVRAFPENHKLVNPESFKVLTWGSRTHGRLLSKAPGLCAMVQADDEPARTECHSLPEDVRREEMSSLPICFPQVQPFDGNVYVHEESHAAVPVGTEIYQ